MVQATKGKVVVGMSGGVDSSASLLLLKKRGYEPIGVSLKYSVWDNECNFKENVCCSKKSFGVAKNICDSLGVPYYKVNVEKQFQNEVINYFKDELKNNRTPSPCVFCNYNLKFKVLLLFARQIGAEFIATGHYAKVKKVGNEFELWRAKDKTKDQTYSLSFLPQEYLKRVVFPLSDMTKEEVYKLAKEEKGFDVFEKTKQSQDFCFVSGRAMPEFLKREIGVNKGEIVDGEGRVLAEHQGLHFYTIGQRKGINLPGGPFYVIGKDTKSNKLVVGKKPFQTRQVDLSYCHFVSGEMPKKKISVRAKVRSSQILSEAILIPYNTGRAKYILCFKKPQNSVTAGQIAVFYQGEKCLGGGVIS